MSIQEVNRPPVDEQNKKSKGSGSWKYILNIVIVLLVTAGSVAVSLVSDFENIKKSFNEVSWGWIGVCFLIVLAGILVKGLILFAFARLYTRQYRFKQALACVNIGFFYDAVTPGASGGQPMQAYTYKKQGVPISSAASIMVMYTIVYQIVLIIYGIVSFIVKFDTLMSIEAIAISVNNVTISLPILPLAIIGFALNLGLILIVLLMSYSRKFHNFIMGPCISLLAKIKILKNPDKTRESLRIQVENFKIELRHLLSNTPFTLLITFLFFLLLTLNFSVPFFVGKALGVVYTSDSLSFWDSIFNSNLHQMVSGIIPIPGEVGTSEYFFNQLFRTYFNVEGHDYVSTTAAQLIWRNITFTIPLIISGFVTAFYRSSPKDQVPQHDSFRETFVSLQRATFVERKESFEKEFETMRLNRELIKQSLKKKKEQDNLDKKKKSSRRIDQTDWNEIEIDDDKSDEDDIK